MTQILGGFQILRVLMLVTRLGEVKHRLGFGNNVRFHWGIAELCVGGISRQNPRIASSENWMKSLSEFFP